jgi:hypothetical protein
MERFIATTGGRPAKNQDLILSEQVLNMLESFISKFGQTIIVVSGCDIDAVAVVTYNVTAGVIYFENKFWIFDALDNFIVAGGFSIDLVKSEVEDTPRTHFDGVVRNTIKTSKLVEANGTPDVVFDENTPRLEDWLNKPTVYRSPDVNFDFDSADLTITGNDQTLDLYAIVPAYAKSVKLQVRLTATGGTDISSILFKKKGATYPTSSFRVDTTYPTIWDQKQVDVELNANREIEYNAFEGTGVTATILIKVISWSF